jgi:hypothetical protein
MSEGEKMDSKRVFLFLLLFVLGASLCFGQEEGTDRPAAVEPGLWERVVALYDEAKEQGEKVPGDVAEWIESDLGREGAWEYKVADVAGGNGGKLEKRLNELGAERWECIQVEALPGTTRLVLKRTKKSYLRRLPLSDLMRLIPLAGGSDEP